MTAQEQAEAIVNEYCPEGGRIQRRGLVDAIRWAIIQADIQRRQPQGFTAAQAGSVAYQLAFMIDEFTHGGIHQRGYPEQANWLAAGRRDLAAIARGEAPAPRKPVERAVVASSTKAKGAGV
jgi:hypothetical protein